jgi:hypothetical protein
VDRRTGVSGAPGPYKGQPTTLAKTQARSAIIHRTVRCATRLSGEPADNDYLRATVEYKSTCHVNSAVAEVRAAKSEGTGLFGVAPDYPMPQEDKAPTVDRAPNPNDWVTWRRTVQRTVPVRCAHRQQPPQRLPWWLGAINTPNHHNFKHPSFLKITFNTRALAFTPRHNTKDQIHSKHLVACEREIFVFI